MDLTINNLCRVCLKNSNFHSNIYKDRSFEEIPVYELVNDLCALGIFVGDGLPEFLCCECFIKVEELKTFKTKAHKGLSALLLLKDKFQNPFIKQEEFDIPGDEYEESFVGTNMEQGFGPIILKHEMLTVYQNRQEELIESEKFDNVGVIGLSATSTEDSPQVDVSLVDMGTHPQYLQSLEHKRPSCDAHVTADAESCTQNINAGDESAFEISENISLSVENEASSSGRRKRSEGQWIQQGEYMNPSLQESLGNEKERGREEKDAGEGGEGLRATVPEKKLESFECYHCGKVLTSKHCLVQHMNVHGFDNSCDCKICKNVFQNKANLKSHDSTNTRSKPYKCGECRKSFSESDNLKAHMRLHTGLKPYDCSECSKRYSRNDSLQVHMRSHTGSKPYKCAECSKCYSPSDSLKKHTRSHTGSKPYKCPECSKSYSRNDSLNVHMRSHTGSKPYKCAECSKCFSRSDSHKTHMRLHTGSKPYRCPECSQGLKESGHLHKHMRKHTGSKT